MWKVLPSPLGLLGGILVAKEPSLLSREPGAGGGGGRAEVPGLAALWGPTSAGSFHGDTLRVPCPHPGSTISFKNTKQGSEASP